jgi:hypothetical protein
MKVAEPTIERLVQYHRLPETLREIDVLILAAPAIGSAFS